MSENWLKRSLEQIGMIKKSLSKQPSKPNVFAQSKKNKPTKQSLAPIKMLPASNTLIFLKRSTENLLKVTHDPKLKDILRNFLIALSQHSEQELEKLFFTMGHQNYRYKNLLHGWFKIKNDKQLTWSEISIQLKKFQRPLAFEDNDITRIKNYLIYKLTSAYTIVEKSTPYLVHVIDLHLQKIRLCAAEKPLQALFENPRDLAGKHSIPQLLSLYCHVPTYHVVEGKLSLKPWLAIHAFIQADMQAIPAIGVSQSYPELVS